MNRAEQVRLALAQFPKGLTILELSRHCRLGTDQIRAVLHQQDFAEQCGVRGNGRRKSQVWRVK
jgi:hypothetical protein